MLNVKVNGSKINYFHAQKIENHLDIIIIFLFFLCSSSMLCQHLPPFLVCWGHSYYITREEHKVLPQLYARLHVADLPLHV